jgi:very-short-patch-repair endonuclease
MKALARKLRKESTDAERVLWKYLRAHRMAGFKFKRQVLIEPYIVDFACLEARLIIEADGGQHLLKIEEDSARTEFLESLGYEVMRFWNNEILCDTRTVMECIHNFLIKSPLPSPLPEGEGDMEIN